MLYLQHHMSTLLLTLISAGFYALNCTKRSKKFRKYSKNKEHQRPISLHLYSIKVYNIVMNGEQPDGGVCAQNW